MDQTELAPGFQIFWFDSFEGLPENWHENAAKGAYSTNGAIPDIQDHRVRFIPGLFQESLPKFMKDFSTRKRTVLHMDADLYSSTFYALSQCDSVIKPETILVFDEFTACGNKDEFAALYDYCRSHYRKWKIVAARDDFVKIAIKIIQ